PASSTCFHRHTRPEAVRGGRAEPCASVLSLRRFPLGHRDRLPIQLRAPVHPANEGVLEEIDVVSLRTVVRPGVCTATFLARETRDHHAIGQLEQEAELERLREVAVEDLPLVLDVNIAVPLAQAGDDLTLPL